MEAYSAIEADPEGEEARQARKQQEEADRLARQKNAFTRAIEEPADGNRSDP
jgi:hypothetical protein